MKPMCRSNTSDAEQGQRIMVLRKRFQIRGNINPSSFANSFLVSSPEVSPLVEAVVAKSQD